MPVPPVCRPLPAVGSYAADFHMLCPYMQAVKIPCSAVSWPVRLYTAFSCCNLFIIPLLVSCPCRASLCAMPLPWPMSVSCVCGLWPVAGVCVLRSAVLWSAVLWSVCCATVARCAPVVCCVSGRVPCLRILYGFRPAVCGSLVSGFGLLIRFRFDVPNPILIFRIGFNIPVSI